MDCNNCTIAKPIEDQGILLFISPQLHLLEKCKQPFTTEQPVHFIEGGQHILSMKYASRDLLLKGLKRISEALTETEQLDIHIGVGPDSFHAASKPLRLSQFFARIKHHTVVSMMTEGLFSSHMQPIVDIQSQQVIGYEFLLRPAEGQARFNPFELFTVAQQTGLHSFLDRAARISAIETSALHLPHGVKRFVNFLPSSIYNPNYCLSHTFKAIENNRLDPQDFVFEVVETERIEDIGHLKKIFAVYQEHGMKVALDDVGSGFATLEVLPELMPDYVKIDRGLIDMCDSDDIKQRKISDIISCAHQIGAIVLAEGMERKEEWDYCKSLGIDLAQGYLLGKPSAAPLNKAVIEF
ncbi:EAL domain, c-di-GMP-specific phosphodiesterase class I (or its enzymatically inactive variant) [Paenibacillus sp. 1_12]|uniref:EAL domain-containing protein n=1 Tax=Paenibacillus sp. 1_12 TaxID=1566278 RepID=UPI0008E36322|nr:EAL domain-containing protein [Paenibacillus sp. 1_12]SFL69276.1 EAL domain, c-di-GMP-specific phosphodiesterase class I (or its enzymatically inactive variant) [Paenibacillus sp. 1_12]